MSKDEDYQLVVRNNEDFADLSLLSLYGKKVEDSYKQDIVTNIELEEIIPSIQNRFFCNLMVDFVNKLELSDQKIRIMGL